MSAGALPVPAAERETLVNGTDADDVVTILTHQRRHLSALRKHAGFTEVRSGFDGATEWAEFTIPADRWSPVTGGKRPMAPGRAAQLAAARAASPVAQTSALRVV